MNKALELAKKGFKVFPVNEDKTPKVKWKEKATDDLFKVEQMFRNQSNSKGYIGIVTGGEMGLTVLDLDYPKPNDLDQKTNGLDSINKYLREKHNKTLDDYTKGVYNTTTKNNGKHYYFRSNKDFGRKVGVLEKVDFLSGAGYVCFYGENTDFELVDLPKDLEKLAYLDHMNGVNNEHAPLKPSFVLPNQIQVGQRNDILFRYGCSLRSKGANEQEIRNALTTANDERCNSPLPQKDIDTLVKQCSQYEQGFRGTDTVYQKLIELNALDEVLKDFTDLTLSKLFSEVFKDIARYNRTAKEWYVFNGKFWENDIGSLRTEGLAKQLKYALDRLVMSTKSDQEKADYLKNIKRTLGSKTNRSRIIKDSQEVNFCDYDDFDKNDYLFNCQNGTLNLRTGEFYAHTPSDLLSMVSNAYYDPSVAFKNSLFYKTINEIFDSDFDEFGNLTKIDERVDYLQVLLGYALTGNTQEEKVYIFYGPSTRNGKSTITELILELMGTRYGYGVNVQPNTLEQRKYNDSRAPSGDIARLQDKRFALMSEPSQSMIFNEALLKTLIGRDSITARKLFEKEFEFKPKFKMIINTNHLPKVTDTTLFKSKRIVVIPFNRRFKDCEQIKNLKEKLKSREELSALLNWAIEGYKLFDLVGFTVPKVIQNAIDDYERTSDKIGNFIDDCITEGQGVQVKVLYEHYKTWAQENGLKAEGSQKFRVLLQSKGFVIHDREYIGKIRLKSVIKDIALKRW